MDGIKKCDKRQREERKREEERKEKKRKMGCLLLNTSQCHPNVQPPPPPQSVSCTERETSLCQTQYHNLYSGGILSFPVCLSIISLPVCLSLWVTPYYSLFFFFKGVPHCQAVRVMYDIKKDLYYNGRKASRCVKYIHFVKTLRLLVHSSTRCRLAISPAICC